MVSVNWIPIDPAERKSEYADMRDFLFRLAFSYYCHTDLVTRADRLLPARVSSGREEDVVIG